MKDHTPNPLPLWLCLLSGHLLALTVLPPWRPIPPDLSSRVPAGFLAPASLDPDRMPLRDLRRLPGIGEKRALSIARARWEEQLTGGPDSWDRIPGIGVETVRGIRAWLARANRGRLEPESTRP